MTTDASAAALPTVPGLLGVRLANEHVRGADSSHLLEWAAYFGRGLVAPGASDILALPRAGAAEPSGGFELPIHRRVGHTSGHGGPALGRIVVSWTPRTFVVLVELRPSALIDPAVREDLELWMRTLRHCNHIRDLDLHETWPLSALRAADPRDELPAVHAYLLDQIAALNATSDADPTRLRRLTQLGHAIHRARFPSRQRAEILRFNDPDLD